MLQNELMQRCERCCRRNGCRGAKDAAEGTDAEVRNMLQNELMQRCEMCCRMSCCRGATASQRKAAE
eukprot:14379805-Alexandrium_andersonii.AAC.1